MKTSRNFARKSAPVIPSPAPEPKRIKLSPAMESAATDAVKRFRAAQAEYNAAADQARQQHAKLMEVAQMHDNLFAAIVTDGGATIEDYKHGFELRDGHLVAKPDPAQQSA